MRVVEARGSSARPPRSIFCFGVKAESISCPPTATIRPSFTATDVWIENLSSTVMTLPLWSSRSTSCGGTAASAVAVVRSCATANAAEARRAETNGHDGDVLSEWVEGTLKLRAPAVIRGDA